MVPDRVTKQRASSKTKSHHHGSGLVMQGISPTRMSEDTPKVPTPPPLLSLPPDEPLINNSKFIGIVLSGSYARMSVRRLLTSDWQTHRGVYPELEWVVGKAEIPGGWLTAK